MIRVWPAGTMVRMAVIGSALADPMRRKCSGSVAVFLSTRSYCPLMPAGVSVAVVVVAVLVAAAVVWVEVAAVAEAVVVKDNKYIKISYYGNLIIIKNSN